MFSVGIVGLPNAGKSTLFQALTKKQVEISNRPFTTIKPNAAVVAVPDARLEKLEKISVADEIVPATIEFIDIAGLVKNAHLGEGLGNEFLSYIRNVDAIIHLVRIFEDENVSHIHPVRSPIPGVSADASRRLTSNGASEKIDPQYDIEVINDELAAAEIEKPTLIIFNGSENQLNKNQNHLTLSAKLELTLSELDDQERQDFMEELGLKKSGLEKLIKESYKLLDLITFFTVKGQKQLRAWELKRGTPIIEAAGKIHTDFAENFIKAEVVNWQKLVEAHSTSSGQAWQKAKEKGWVKTAGKEYTIQDGDVVEVKI